MFDFTLQQLLLRFTGLLIIFAVHGWVVAATATLLGDAGPKYDGRRTLNPFSHLDLLGGLGVLLFSLGWIKPIAIDPSELRHPRHHSILIVLTGLIAIIALVFILLLLRPVLFTLLPGTAGFTALAQINTTARIGVYFVAFNLLPLPPLTGGYLWMAIVPQRWGMFGRYRLYLVVLMAIFVFTGAAASLVSPLYGWLAGYILN